MMDWRQVMEQSLSMSNGWNQSGRIMSKPHRKQIIRLQSRQKSFDSLPSNKKDSRTRPGSMNPKKGSDLKGKR